MNAIHLRSIPYACIAAIRLATAIQGAGTFGGISSVN